VPARLFKGGESAGLKILDASCKSTAYVTTFEKPKTSSTNTPKDWEKPATTGLSPYLKFGCVSVRMLWHKVNAHYMKAKTYTKPPASLHGQLYFRDMFYLLSYCIPNWDKPVGNPVCKDIAWDTKNTKFLTAWEEGKTGYPYIDALMRQLDKTGWMHHLGRHAVSCFLTRGDLYQHWTHGRDVFDQKLLDADWALNNGNWLWLAGVAPFSMPYFRIYDPMPGKDSSLNAEQSGDFVRFFVPELKDMPDKYIYSPWTAPKDVQVKAKCVIGKDYPLPIVDHKVARNKNLEKFKKGLATLKSGAKKRPWSDGSSGVPTKRQKT
jgi:cryptochrome